MMLWVIKSHSHPLHLNNAPLRGIFCWYNRDYMKYAKKHLGQNFLKSKRAVDAMIDAVAVLPGETVLEIGPGRGALTGPILETGARVVAIEKDPEMIHLLEEKFSTEIAGGQLVIIEGDVLQDSLSDHGLVHQEYSVIANIPYYITGAIIRMLLESDSHPRAISLLVQKEVAERITGRETKKQKESILSLSVKAYGTAQYVMSVGAKSFSPPPKVDSAIIAIRDISKEQFVQSGVSENQFFSLVKQGFAQKRKTLLNNLKQAGYDTEPIKAFLSEQNLDSRIRAEDLQIDHWFWLAKHLGK